MRKESRGCDAYNDGGGGGFFFSPEVDSVVWLVGTVVPLRTSVACREIVPCWLWLYTERTVGLHVPPPSYTLFFVFEVRSLWCRMWHTFKSFGAPLVLDPPVSYQPLV